MYTPIDQDAIDERIHRFMARKSPLKTLSKTIADRLVSSAHATSAKSDITYEPIKWQTRQAAR